MKITFEGKTYAEIIDQMQEVFAECFSAPGRNKYEYAVRESEYYRVTYGSSGRGGSGPGP